MLAACWPREPMKSGYSVDRVWSQSARRGRAVSSTSRTWRGTNPWIKFFVGTRSFNATKQEGSPPVIFWYLFRLTNQLFPAFHKHVPLLFTQDKRYVARPGSKFDLVPEKSVPPRKQKTHDALDLMSAPEGGRITTYRTEHNNQPLTIVQQAYLANVDASSWAIEAACLLFCCIFYHCLNSRFLTMRQRHADFCARKNRNRTMIRG